jgi:hypothetical protein
MINDDLMLYMKYVLASFLIIFSSSVFARLPDFSLPKDEWKLISLPAQPPNGTDTVAAIFGDDFTRAGINSAATYGNKWVLYSYAPNGYEKLGYKDTLEQGKGYWIIQVAADNVNLDMPGGSTETASAFEFSLEPPLGARTHQWNLAGNPFSKSKKLSDFLVETSSGVCSGTACNLNKAGNEKILHNEVWRYDGGYQKISGNTSLNAWDGFWCAALEKSKGMNKLSIVSGIYGTEGPHNVAGPWSDDPNPQSFTYYPSDINTEHPTPVVFFVPGYSNIDPKEYETLIKLVASHGISVIYTKDGRNKTDAKELISRLKKMAANPRVAPYIDTTRIGVMGYSSGGGHAFKILSDFSTNEGWGENGRFLFVMEPWFAFDMTPTSMRSLPSNTNVVFTQFGDKGFNTDPVHNKAQDPRIVLSEYYLLDSIPADKKDYQIITHDTLSPSGFADHRYPTNYYGERKYSQLQGLLKPLDALMDYTFRYPAYARAQNVALGVGNDDPYGSNGQDGIQLVKPIKKYGFPCTTHNKINYCDKSNW